MKAIVITKPGDADVLELSERAVPKPQSKEVLVKVAAAGINWPDVAQRRGQYPPPPGASVDIPGLEIAGVVSAFGPDCSMWNIGDRVCALVTGGGYAEYCCAPEGQCLPIPPNLSFVEAASLPETYFTVWSNVIDRGKLKPGETFLVHGGAGGIGVAAIQIAKAWGAAVFTTASSDEKCSFCERLGADKAINYKAYAFKDVIKSLTNGKGVDVILDIIGGSYTPDNLNALSEDGRLVMINHTGGDVTTVKLSLIMRKRLTLTGSTLRSRDISFKSAIAVNLKKTVWPWLISGSVKPVVYQTFPLEQAADAHRQMEGSLHRGKIVLEL
jgi:NADPH2:quinone reductase